MPKTAPRLPTLLKIEMALAVMSVAGVVGSMFFAETRAPQLLLALCYEATAVAFVFGLVIGRISINDLHQMNRRAAQEAEQRLREAEPILQNLEFGR